MIEMREDAYEQLRRRRQQKQQQQEGQQAEEKGKTATQAQVPGAKEQDPYKDELYDPWC